MENPHGKGGKDAFRSQFHLQETRDKHQEGGNESDCSSMSSQSSIFQQGRVPIQWLVSESGSSAPDRSERASRGGKDSQKSSSSSSIEQLAGKGLLGVAKPKAAVAPAPDDALNSPSSSSWFAATFEESETTKDTTKEWPVKPSGAGSSSVSNVNAVPKGAIHGQLAEAQLKEEEEEEEEISEDVRRRCMDILASLPTDKEGRLTSLGSLSHKSGTCKPCAYWFKRACKHGVACYNCHIAHKDQKPKRLRSSKAKIQQETCENKIPEDSEMTHKDWKKNMTERAIPSTPGPVGEQTVELKVTAGLLKEMSTALGFQVTEPPRPTFPSEPSAPSPTKTSL